MVGSKYIGQAEWMDVIVECRRWFSRGKHPINTGEVSGELLKFLLHPNHYGGAQCFEHLCVTDKLDRVADPLLCSEKDGSTAQILPSPYGLWKAGAH